MVRRKRGPGLRIVTEPLREEASIWRRHHDAPKPHTRQSLFEYYQTWATKIAYREYSRRPPYGLDRKDLEQFAFAGLLEAIDRFNQDFRTPFKGYAIRRIKGSISAGLESSSEAGAQYSFSRRASRERLSSLKTSSDEPKDTSGRGIISGLAIGFILEDLWFAKDEDTPDPAYQPYESIAWSQLKRSLIHAVESLSETPKFIVIQHYKFGLSFSDISDILQLSKGRISQIHKSALLDLARAIKS